MAQAIQLIDDFGTWDLIGIIQPIYEQWVEFGYYSESLSTTTRLIFSGDVENARSYAYIRARYEITGNSMYGDWVRVYPKEQREIIIYPHPVEFEFSNINPRRFWQILKRHWDRKKTGTAPDTNWGLTIQVFSEKFSDDPSSPELEGLILGLI